MWGCGSGSSSLWGEAVDLGVLHGLCSMRTCLQHLQLPATCYPCYPCLKTCISFGQNKFLTIELERLATLCLAVMFIGGRDLVAEQALEKFLAEQALHMSSFL